MTQPSKSVALITMSTRTPRVGPDVAAFVKSVIDDDAQASNVDLVPVDLADFKLPVFDEAIVPGMNNPATPDGPRFTLPHSVAWSAEIRRHDGYVLVIPEYNYGLTGGTKNAIDYLLYEWTGKPVAVISYGIVGGAFASEQAKHVLSHMRLRVAETLPQLSFAGGSHSPSMMSAMLKGELDEESKKAWKAEKSEEILKAFGELKVLLHEEKEENKKEEEEKKE